MPTCSLALAFITIVFAGGAALTACQKQSKPSQKQSKPSWVNIAFKMHLQADGAGLAVNWSADGKYLVATSDWGQEISLWDQAGQKRTTIFQTSGTGPHLGNMVYILNSDDQIVTDIPQYATSIKSSDGTLMHETLNVWSMNNHQVVYSYGLSQSGPSPFAVYPRLNIAVGGSWSQKMLSILSLPELSKVSEIPTDSFPTSIAFFPDGKQIVVGQHNGECTVIELQTGRQQWSFTQFRELVATTSPGWVGQYVHAEVGSLAVSPNGRYIATGPGAEGIQGGDWDEKPTVNVAPGTSKTALEAATDKVDRVTVWDINLKAETAILPFPMENIRQLVWDPKGKFLAIAYGNDQVLFWSPFHNELIPYALTVKPYPMSLAISPSGELLAVTTSSGVDLYSISEGK